MEKRLSHLLRLIETISPWLVLLILLGYTYARFFQAFYPGFYFDPQSGEITGIYVDDEQKVDLQVGDKLIQVGAVSLDEYLTDLRQNLFENAEQGQVVPIIVERGGQSPTILWEYPHNPRQEIITRLTSYWWLSYIFWFFGTLTTLIVRPRDQRWRLLVAFNYLTAVWLLVGTLSAWRVWDCAIVMRMAIWLCVPVYWHLHWTFPKPLAKAPAAIWIVLYLIGGLLAVFQWFQLLPPTAFFLGFLLAVLGSIFLLVAHAIVRPIQRRDLGLLAIGVALALTPSIALVIVGLIGSWKTIEAVSLLGLPILPGIYFYVIYRRQLGNLELRANRLFSLYLFFVLLGSALIIVVALVYAAFPPENAPLLLGLVVPFLVALVTVFGLTTFQHWVDRHLLGMPLPPTHLLQAYDDLKSINLDMPALVRLLRDEILPSLLVRQSALMLYDENFRTTLIYAYGVGVDEIPQDCNDPRLLAQAGQYRPIVSSGGMDQSFTWVRLALPLKIGNSQVGWWLLGRRDPDDYYSQAEVAVLQSFAIQTAFVLSNILKTERLHELYKANIEREENQRKHLSNVLHDDVLGQMALLAMNMPKDNTSPQYDQAYQSIATQVREIINTLRPPMLNYGLRAAIEELADEIPELVVVQVSIAMEVPPSEVRYPAEVELHLYRIVQQAYQNALMHAQASVIRISGCLEPELVDLVVKDDGVGFVVEKPLNLVGLLKHKNYGLVGMYERAALIGAQIQIDSTPQDGTGVRVVWKSSQG